MTGLLAALALLPLLLGAVAPAHAQGGGPLYLALGDSLAAGVGASDRAATGYVPLLFDHLRNAPSWRGRGLGLLNLGVPGETTTSLLRPGGQLERARAALAARNGDADPNNDVEVITIDTGGNDLLILLADVACVLNPEEPGCQARLENALASATANLGAILRQLRAAAGPDAIIIAMTYYNPFSGGGLPLAEVGDQALARLNTAIMAAAADPQVRARVADVAPLFAGQALRLTHMGRFPPDVHPNDDGYVLIGQAFVAALPPLAEPTPVAEASAGDGATLWIFIAAGAGGGAVVAAGGILWLVRRRPPRPQLR